MENRRNEKVMIDLIMQIANSDERIRAVIMNGSRASPSAVKDIFQDYDIVYLVTDVESFVVHKSWINCFGEMLIMQTPDEMDGNWPKNKTQYAYLMQFKDWNRIDLTLVHVDKFPHMHRDSQSILLLDKDNRIRKFDPPSDDDYLPHPPTEKEFLNCINEFLWVSTYVAKGIWRNELTYAKHAAEQNVKEQLIKLLTWHAALKTNYKIPLGNHGKYLPQHIDEYTWEQFKETYVNADYGNMWQSLFKMCEIFNEVAIELSSHFGYSYNQNEFQKVVNYLHDVKNKSITR